MSAEAEAAVEKPVPLDDQDQRPYWVAASEGRLSLQRCVSCGRFVHPPGPGCPHCGGAELIWDDLGSQITGQVYSFVVVHRAFLRSFLGDVPYVVALVELDDVGDTVRITGNVINVDDVADITVGTRVRMVWETRAPGVTVPQWEPVRA
jgi:uncharacterized OB-fold protein